MPAVNSKIIKADYNSIRDKVVAVLGNGSGNSGYGQQARIVSTAVDENTKVTINEWANLRFDIINAYKHINGSNPTTAVVAEGNTIRYTGSFTPDTGAADVPQKQYDDWANDITNTRFTVAAGESATTAVTTTVAAEAVVDTAANISAAPAAVLSALSSVAMTDVGYITLSVAQARALENGGAYKIAAAVNQPGGATANVKVQTRRPICWRCLMASPCMPLTTVTAAAR